MSNSLAILIPTITGREKMMDILMGILSRQAEGWCGDFVSPSLSNIWSEYSFNGGAVIVLKDNKQMSIGQKRNVLVGLAVDRGCTHRAFIDDDDTVTDDYLDLNMPGVYGDYDCNSLVGIYSVNGKIDPKKHIFYHSLKYDHWWEDDKGYYRNPNHLNVIKLSLIKDIKFPESNFGEDGQFSERLHASGVLKKEYEITKPFYNYLFRTKTNGV